jgi:hypothetical protein
MSVPIEQKSYEMPPRGGFTITLFTTVADIDRSADFYEKAATSYGKVEARSSSRSRSVSTARFAATSAILTDTSSRSDRAPTSHEVDARSEWALLV